MTSYAVISSDLDPRYSWYLPLTCLAWRDVCGCVPLVLLVGDQEEWQRDRVGGLALAHAQRVGAKVFFVSRQDGYRTATVAQVSRLFAWEARGLDYRDDDLLLTTDVDMWPLSREWFAPVPPPDGMVLFYSNGCGDDTFPICYLRANFATWQAVMGPQHGGIAEGVRRLLGLDVGHNPDYWAEWYCDQRAFASRLRAWDGYPDRCFRLDRDGHPPLDRIWYGNWPEPMPPGMVDAHLCSSSGRPPWEKLRELLVYAGVRDLEAADGYVKEAG